MELHRNHKKIRFNSNNKLGIKNNKMQDNKIISKKPNFKIKNLLMIFLNRITRSKLQASRSPLRKTTKLVQTKIKYKPKSLIMWISISIVLALMIQLPLRKQKVILLKWIVGSLLCLKLKVNPNHYPLILMAVAIIVAWTNKHLNSQMTNGIV
jgi:hypothetical protein